MIYYLGVFLVTLPFIGVFLFAWHATSFLEACGMVGVWLAVIACIAIGQYLIVK